ncbi:hypothetical protein HYR99_35085 [Candidatus Poribacteria bacterium]|nr:hypothetical protein [Candidatus Poribacteria bacterium]
MKPIEVEQAPITCPDAPVSEVDTPDLWQELESLSAELRSLALQNGQTVLNVLKNLPQLRQKICEELYGVEQVEAWEKERKDGK